MQPYSKPRQAAMPQHHTKGGPEHAHSLERTVCHLPNAAQRSVCRVVQRPLIL